MPKENLAILKKFGLADLPDLDTVVLGALELFQDTPLPKTDFGKYKRPLVVGSGNAEATGKIIFRNSDVVFASESNFKEKLENIRGIEEVVVISASGEKHAPIIAKTAKKYNKKIILITNNPNSSAGRELSKDQGDEEYIFPKNREPYTYNTSTYLGMILSSTKEDPREIYDFIKSDVAKVDFSRFSNYDKFFLIVPTKFSEVISMLEVKFTELFGRQVAVIVKTLEFIPHATTLVPSKELFISFGAENNTWGNPEDRITIPLPENADYGAMMAIGYYTVGQIQKVHKPYFKENVVNYVKKSSEIFGHEIKAIVK